jgi:copper resistance protein B
MMRLAPSLAAAATMALTPPAFAQDHSTHNMPGMSMPAAQPKAAKPKPKARKPAPRRSAPAARPARRALPKPAQPPAAHQGHDMKEMDPPSTPGMSASPSETMDHDAMPGMDKQNEHAGHDMTAMPAMQPTGTALPAGSAPAPKPPMDHYADRQFPPAEMARARQKMMAEEGGQTLSQVMFNLAEYQVRQGRDDYRWDGEAWFGGDINRLTLKSEGEGAFRDGLEAAEIQALYSRAIGPYFNLQAGVRYDFKPNPSRAYAVLGFEGLAPYWFEVEGAAFLSNKGDLLGRLEGYYDQRLT